MTQLSTQIRDAIFSRLEASQFIQAFKTVQRIPPPTFQNLALPAIGVFRSGENHEPDGDYNVVPFRFKTTCDIAISILVDANDPSVASGVLDQYVDQVQDLILADGSFFRLQDIDTGEPIIEGMPRMVVRTDWPTDSQRYMGRAVITMTFAYRCFFAVLPTVPLKQIDVTIAGQPNVSVEIDLPQ